MGTVSQTTYSNAFAWMKSVVFWLKFHWSLFLRVQLIITKHWFSRRQAIIWSNADLIHWCIYVALGGDELTELLCIAWMSCSGHSALSILFYCCQDHYFMNIYFTCTGNTFFLEKYELIIIFVNKSYLCKSHMDIFVHISKLQNV